MKTRSALFVAALVLLTVSAFADDPAPAPGPALRDWGGKMEWDPLDRYDRTPKLNYILDGVEYPAGTPLPDVPLHWVVMHDDVLMNTVHIFSSADKAKAYEQGRLVAADGINREVTTNCSWTASYTRFEKSRNCGDFSYITITPPDGQYDQLDSIGWNNSISCVKSACNTSLSTALYTCRYFEMDYVPNVCENPDTMTVGPGVIIYDLTWYGFNNETSSTRFE